MPTAGVRRRPAPPWPLSAAGSAVAVMSLAPVAYLFLREGFSVSSLRAELDNPATGPLVRNTLALVATVGTVATVVAVALAVLVARTDLPGRRAWTVLFTLPLGVPTFVASYAWLGFTYRHAPGSELFTGLRGASLILSLSLYPYVFLPVLAALRNIDPAHEEVARSLGLGPVAAFLKVTVPQLRPAVAGGVLIIWLHLVAEFGALQLLRYQTLTTAVVRRATVLGAPDAARSLAVLLTLLAVGLLVLDAVLRGRSVPHAARSNAARRTRPWRLGAVSLPALLVAVAVVVASLGVPVYMAVTGLARQAGDRGIDWAQLAAATATTTRFALLGAAVATVVSLPVSVLAARHPGAVATVVERSTWVAHALPGVVLALSLVFLGARWLSPLYQTQWLLIAAYTVMYLPLAVGSQQVGLLQASPRYEEVSRALGLGPAATFVRVTLRLASPAVFTGALLVALDVAKELTTTLMLRPTGTTTLATALWRTTNGDVLDFTSAAPFGAALLAVGVVPAALLARRTVSGHS